MDTLRRALVVVDVQQEYFAGPLEIEYPPREDSRTAIVRAVESAHAAGLPVVMVQHAGGAGAAVFDPDGDGYPLHPDIAALRPATGAQPWHDVVKHHGSVYAGTALADWLRERGVTTVTLVGYMINNCILASAVAAEALGFDTEVLADATGAIPLANDAGTRDAREVHSTLLTLLHSNWASVANTDGWAAAVTTGTPLSRSNLVASAVAGRAAGHGARHGAPHGATSEEPPQSSGDGASR
ncbi:isochorismatase family protein [Microbacterium sp. cf332]|uniref:isochorismatase family protein n=1 Tax=Microbacterium sp. cf332 TaxID=1761804 RepID=UPI000890C4AB|nr:isochorismatase family protein [Microbacterium sp. cf332]SDQ85828.1 Nicotinamidase-related amidase [Microbacterium sp. cf332]